MIVDQPLKAVSSGWAGCWPTFTDAEPLYWPYMDQDVFDSVLFMFDKGSMWTYYWGIANGGVVSYGGKTFTYAACWGSGDLSGLMFHEWLHGVDHHYRRLGYRSIDPDAPATSYDEPPAPDSSDFMTGRAKQDGEYCGFSAGVWLAGTPNDVAAVLPAQLLSPYVGTGVLAPPTVTWAATAADRYDVSVRRLSDNSLVSSFSTTENKATLPIAPQSGETYQWSVTPLLGGVSAAAGDVLSFTRATDSVPDLYIDSVSVAKSVIAANESFTAMATVHNYGNVAAGPFLVELYKNSLTAPVSSAAGDVSLAVASLAAGATKTLSFTGLSYAAAGQYRLWAYASRAGAVAEFDTTNNVGPSSGLDMTVVAPPGTPQALPFVDDFSTDKGWSGYAAGGWTRGPAVGQNGDPGTDATPTSDNSVLGYNLGGAYTDDLAGTTITSPALDCSQSSEVVLTFRRYLGVDRNSADRAAIRVCADESHWTTVWQNGSDNLYDMGWTRQTVDLSASAAGNPRVYVQFVMGPTNTGGNGFGWNIDDVRIGVPVVAHHFGLNITPSQIANRPLTGTVQIVAYDAANNVLRDYDAQSRPITLTVSPSGALSGVGSDGGNVINTAAEVVDGTAWLPNRLTYRGVPGTRTISASAGAATGMSSPISFAAEPFATLPFSEDFEAAQLSSPWYIAHSGTTGAIYPTNWDSPHGGTQQLVVGQSNSETPNVSEAVLPLNLAGKQSVVLRYWEREASNTRDTMPAAFTTRSAADGVAISNDGVHWYRAEQLGSQSFTWSEHVVDLDAACAAAGISYTSTCYIKFQQCGKWWFWGGGMCLDDVSIKVENTPPTDLSLTPSTIADDQPSGSTVGTLSTVGVGAPSSFTYALVAGTGSSDNASFTIAGAALKTATALNAVLKPSYSIRVKTTNVASLSFEKALTVTVTHVNHPPTALALSPTTLLEHRPANTRIGTLSTTDADPTDTFTYSLVVGTGSTDNASFSISGADLSLKASADYATKSSYALRVRSTDNAGLYVEAPLTVTIKPARIVVTPASRSIPEGSSATFAVSLSSQPPGNVAVAVARSAGDADLTVMGGASLGFTPSNWSVPQTVTVGAAEDADATNGSASIACTAAGWTTASVAVAEVDNDLRILATPPTVTVPEGGSATFGVALAGQPAANVAVSVSRASGDTDLSVQSGAALLFTTTNWNTPQTVTLRAAEDADGLAGVASIVCAGTGWASTTVTAIEAENDPSILASVGAVTVPEGGPATFSVRLNLPPAATTIVAVTRLSGDSDVLVQSGASLVFTTSNWNTPQTVTLRAAEDKDAAHGVATIRCGAAGWAAATVTATEADNDLLIGVSSHNRSVPEGGTAGFTVSLAGQPTANVTVTTARTAGDTDLSVAGGASLTFTPSNWNVGQTVTLRAGDDADAIHGTATFTLNAAGWTATTVTATEVDNDLVIGVSSHNRAVPEGGTATFAVSLAARPAGNVTVTTARAAGDTDLSVAGGASLTFTPSNWNVGQTVTLRDAQDADAISGSATFTLSAAGWTSTTGTATEIDNDLVIGVSSHNRSVPEGGTAGFTVSLAGKPEGNVVVSTARTAGDSDLTVAGGGSLTFTPSNWNVGQTVTLAAAQDADAIGGSATFTLSAAGWAAATVNATEVDNDLVIGVSSHSKSVPEGGTASFTVSLAGKPAGNVTVSTARTSGDTDLSVSAGASLTFTPTNWNVAQTVTLRDGEDADAINGTAVFTVSAAGWTAATVNATEIDNDLIIGVSQHNRSVPEGGSATFLVSLAGKPAANVTVTVARTSGDTDLTVSSGATLVFTPTNWNVGQTVRIRAAEDADALNGVASFTVSASGWASAAVTATEIDNDHASGRSTPESEEPSG